MRLASLAGGRFNALRTHEWTGRKARHVIYLASHYRVTHHGSRVAPQRCPILRVSRLKVTDPRQSLKERMVASDLSVAIKGVADST